jgi:hypothetical protein
MITRTCKQCGQTYQTFPSVKPLYCSMKCVGEAKKRGQFIECAQCGKQFWQFASRPESRYCSKSCVRTARNLTDENPAFHRDITGEKNPMYGKGNSGSANGMYGKRREQAPRWKDGKRHRPDGYIRVMVPDDYPNPCEEKNGVKYALEHRVAIEQHIGRYLSPVEVVHHIDGNPSNNAIENLRLYANQAEHIRDAHG